MEIVVHEHLGDPSLGTIGLEIPAPSDVAFPLQLPATMEPAGPNVGC